MELDLGQARWRAKELLRAARAGDAGALARLRPDRPPRLADARADWGEREEVELDTGLAYARDRPVRVRVRKRGRRYDLDDLGAAVADAGAPAGWLTVAARVVVERGLNVNRTGRVFVPVVEGRDLDALVTRVAETSPAPGECKPASTWVKADRLHPLIPRETPASPLSTVAAPQSSASLAVSRTIGRLLRCGSVAWIGFGCTRI
jgi:hypothetical protein